MPVVEAACNVCGARIGGVGHTPAHLNVRDQRYCLHHLTCSRWFSQLASVSLGFLYRKELRLSRFGHKHCVRENNIFKSNEEIYRESALVLMILF